jgi:hypothetical protein
MRRATKRSLTARGNHEPATFSARQGDSPLSSRSGGFRGDWLSRIKRNLAAIDLKSFRLSDGRKVSVLEDFGRPTREPSSPPGIFLRTLARAQSL